MTDFFKNPPLSLGFIGGGINSAVGQTHFCASQLDGLWKVEAGVFSRHQDVNAQTASRWNVNSDRVYNCWQEMIVAEKERLDAVAVLVPTPDHAEILSALLENNVPIICEKAMVSSLDEGLKIQQASRASKRFLAVTYNYSGYPMVRELQARIRKGEFGTIRQLHIEMPQEGFIRPPAIAGEASPPQSWRLTDQYIPTVCLDLGVHLHHLASFLTDQNPASLASEFSHYSSYPNIVDDVQVWMRYDSGMRANLWMTKTAIGNRNGLRVRVYGDKARAEWYQLESEQLSISYLNGSQCIIDRGGQAIVASQARYNRMKVGHPSGFIEAFSNLYGDIAEALWETKDGKSVTNEYVFGVDVAVDGLEFFHRARDAFESGCWVSLGTE